MSVSSPLTTAVCTLRERLGGVDVVRAGTFGSLASVPLCPSFPFHLWREPADCVVLHEPNPVAGTSLFLRSPARCLIIWHHADLLRPWWAPHTYGHVQRALYRRADCVIVSSPSLAADSPLVQEARRVAVIPFGIALERYRQTDRDRAALAEKIRATIPGPRVLFVGRFVYYKGVHLLIDAMSECPGTLVLVGEGPLEEDFRRRVVARGLQDRVVFVGQVSDEALPAYYQASDLLVLPSIAKTEAFGVVQVEAMAAGIPVVSTNLPTGVPWVNQDGVSGLVVPPGDSQALGRAIGTLLADGALRARLGRQASARADRLFSRRGMIDAFRNVVETAVRAPAELDATPRQCGGVLTAKRTLDVLLAGTGLLVSAPLWLIIAAAIKLESPGPVLFGQPRVGERGRIFEALKFRSMIDEAEKATGPVQAAERDPRVTRVGRLLRASALDELPQLWNIARGDMSFVGPRALRPEEIEVDSRGVAVPLHSVPGFAERVSVPPGLTGVAQIYAARDVTRRQKFRFDRLYIRRRSFMLDVRLILVSFWITFRGTWESRDRKF